MKRIIRLVSIIGVVASTLLIYQCSSSRKATMDNDFQTIQTNMDGKGLNLSLKFTKGKAHNHPLMAIWIEDLDSTYIETLFVAESIGRGIFQHGEKSRGKWEPGPIRRPAALPYWGHQRGFQAPDGYYLPTPEDPMPDAVTGPTPQANFILESKTSDQNLTKFILLFEINQSWDWNEFWTNSKYPSDDQYKTSSQPSVIYAATVDLGSGPKEYILEPVGHGHYAGRDGLLYKDLSTLTSALDITGSVVLEIGE